MRPMVTQKRIQCVMTEMEDALLMLIVPRAELDQALMKLLQHQGNENLRRGRKTD